MYGCPAHAAVVAAALVGCGRIGFEPQIDAAGEPGKPGEAAIARPPAFVQNDAERAGAPASTLAAAFSTDVTAGNLIVAAFDYDYDQGGARATNVSDSQGNTFTLVGPYDSSRYRLYVAYAIAAASGPDSVTVALDSSSDSFFEVRVHEYADVSATQPFDTAAGASGTSTAPDGVRSPAITTSTPNELIFGFVVDALVTAGTGFTLRGDDFEDVTEDQIAPTPGSYQVLASATSEWCAMIVAFRGR